MAPIRVLKESWVERTLTGLTGAVAELSVAATSLVRDIATIQSAASESFLGTADEGAIPEGPLHTALPEPLALSLTNAANAIAAYGADPIMAAIWADVTTSGQTISGNTMRRAASRFAGDIDAYCSHDSIEPPRPPAQPCPGDCELRYADSAGQSFDPAKDTSISGMQLNMQMFEGLTILAAGDTLPEPGVASHALCSDDGLHYTFYLRPDARWSNGRGVVAGDFIWSWQRIVDPKTASEHAASFYPIAGGEAINSGRIRDLNQLGVRAQDPHTLEVDLTYDSAGFLARTAMPPYAPTPREAIEEHGAQWTRPGNIITNGAFILTDHRESERSTLTPNPYYWDREHVQVSGVTQFHTTAAETAVQWYDLHKIDWVWRVPNHSVTALRAADRDDFHIDPALAIYDYVFNCERPPFDDVRVRRAFNLAVDKVRLVLHLLGAGQKATWGYTPPGFAQTQHYTPPAGRGRFDTDEAKRLLTEAGYPDGQGFPTIVLLYNTNTNHSQIAVWMQRQFWENLNINVELENVEFPTLLDRLETGEFAMARTTSMAEISDYVGFLKRFSQASKARLNNPAFDALVEKIERESDAEKRNALAAQAERLLHEEVPSLPLFFPTNAYLLRTTIKGFKPNGLSLHHLKHVRFEE